MKSRYLKYGLMLIWGQVFMHSQILLARGPDSAIINTVCFKISHPESNFTSYLFGTHHAFGSEFFDSLVVVNQALLSCDLLIKESIDEPGNNFEEIVNTRTAKHGLDKVLKRSDRSFVDSLFRNSTLEYDKLTPAELQAFLNRYFNERVCVGKAADEYLTLDDHIVQTATRKGIEVIGLESVAQQLELINADIAGMPNKVHKKRLNNVIKKIRSRDRSRCAETNWYANMNIDYQLDEPCTNSLMLTDRNNAWLPEITRQMAIRNCFIAVGLSHLMYNCGLVNQLQGMGYVVEAVELNF